MTQTPYGVMMTTSWGGHLGWFELGGDRWFAKPVRDIFKYLIYYTMMDTDFLPR